MQDFKPGDIIAQDYQILSLLSQGSFGKVYLGRSQSMNLKVAIKVEKSEVSYFNSLTHEVEVLKLLQDVQQVPKIYWFGQEMNLKIMIQNLLGKDLTHYYKKLKRFSYECVCNIAYQMISILEQTHAKNIIHRDLKPENILGASLSDKIYLIDFGIAKNLQQNKKSKEKISFIGTTRYASLAAHLGKEQNRKDDLESLGYILIYFLNGQLPWMNIEKQDSERIEKIGLMKQDISPEELCENLPSQILKYMKYVKGLSVRVKPNYIQLKDLFKVENQNDTMPFDWNKKIRINKRMQSNKSIKSSKSAKILNKSKSQFHKTQNNIQQESSQKLINQPQTPVQKQHQTFVFPDQNDKTLYHSSDENQQQNSISDQNKEKESIKVGYSISYEPSKFSRYSIHNKSPIMQQQKERARVSTLDANPQDYFIMNFQTEQQLQELENQDLAIKYDRLYYQSILYNHKNPILEFKISKCHIFD
ncbi:unnamed protein product [Paramecium pentaurelia]|uniref:Casein kinase I n=1 Tax=Paramecium pentaurelia TaxID=43138 RepID=A0A8S1VFH6_9CILI|nr:unnamed protein product [Paramecium pentaurelia]